MATPLVMPVAQFWDTRTGTPLALGTVVTYEAGTLNPKVTYTDVSATVENSTTVTLDGAGCARIFLAGNYKIFVYAEDGYLVWTCDNVADIAHIYEEWVYPSAAVYVSAVQFKVTGSMTDVFVLGRSLKISDSVTFYGTVASSSYSAGYTYVTISALQPLTNALSFVSVSGATTATKLATPRAINGVPFDGTSDIEIPMREITVRTALTGGTSSCVDQNVSTMLVSGKVCLALVSGVSTTYSFDTSSTATADGVTVIIPYGQSAGTAGRWLIERTKYLINPTSDTDLTFTTTAKGVIFSDGSKIISETGTGMRLIPASDSLPPVVRNTANNMDVFTLRSQAIQGGFKNLSLSTTGLSDLTTVTADYVACRSANGDFIVPSAVSLSISTVVSGVNGLDTGSAAYNAWYNVFVIVKPDGTVAGLLSLSATAPTLPSGYAYFSRVGTIRTQSATNYYPLSIRQLGTHVNYVLVAGSNITAWPVACSGYLTNSEVSLTAFVPPTAINFTARLKTGGNLNDTIYIGRNLLELTSATRLLASACIVAPYGGLAIGVAMMSATQTIFVTSSNSATNAVAVVGYDDNL
jgi:hypothetical protein